MVLGMWLVLLYMSTKVVSNINCPGMLNLLFWQFLCRFLRFTLFLMVLSWGLSWILVMICINFVIIKVLFWVLSGICLCCCGFLAKSYCSCQLLVLSFATFWECYNFVPVPSLITSHQFRKSQRKFAVYNPEGSACYQSYSLCPSH